SSSILSHWPTGAGGACGKRTAAACTPPPGAAGSAFHLLEQMRADGVESVVPAEPRIAIERLQQVEPRSRAVHHRGGDRMVERDHRVVRYPQQETVQREDLRPVRVTGTGRLVVHCRDRGLQLVRTRG